MKKDPAIFEGHGIRRRYDEKTGTWWFSVVDIIQVLTQQPDYVRRTEKGTDYFQFFTQGRKGLLAHCSVGIEPPRTQNGNELPDEIYRD